MRRFRRPIRFRLNWKKSERFIGGNVNQSSITQYRVSFDLMPNISLELDARNGFDPLNRSRIVTMKIDYFITWYIVYSWGKGILFRRELGNSAKRNGAVDPSGIHQYLMINKKWANAQNGRPRKNIDGLCERAYAREGCESIGELW